MIEFQADKNLLEEKDGLKLTVTSCYAREQEFICAQEKNSPSEEKERKYRWNHKEIFYFFMISDSSSQFPLPCSSL